MAKSTINPTVYNQLYRNQVNRGEQTREDDDYIKIPEITIYDVDYSILQYIRNSIKPEVQDRDRMIDVPVMYGSGELWSQIQSNGFMRDEKNKLLCPVITLSRTRMEEYKAFAKLDVNNRVSSRVYYRQGYTQNNARYGSNNRGSTDLPQKEIYITLIPEYYYVYYDLSIWTDFNEQLNKIVEMFIPVNNFVWGNDYQFVTNIEDFSFSTVNISKQERIVKASTRLRVLATLMPAFVERKSSIQKALSIKKVSVAERVISSQNVVESEPSRTRVFSTISLQSNILSLSSLSSDINFVKPVSSNLSVNSSLVSAISFVQKAEVNLSAFGTLSGDINFVQKLQSSLTSSATLTTSALVSKLVSASLTGTGTTTADLTVGSSVDADAAAFFARVTAAGGTLTTTEQTAVNTLVIAMKANGTWTKMKAIYPMVGASAAACRQNLKSASFTGTFSSGWTFANTGATPNGTSAFMDTNLKPSVTMSNYFAHFGFYNRTVNNISGIDIGCYTSSLGDNYFMRCSEFPSNVARAAVQRYGNTAVFTLISKLGFFVGNTIANNNTKIYQNGILKNTNTNIDNAGRPAINIFIGAANNEVLNATQYSNRECAFASIGDGLTDTEAANFYTAVQAFQTSLSRQV